jgi:hypothetical protein
MNWREQIRQWSQWPGWRTHAPAAGSFVAHIAVVGIFAGMMATAITPTTPRPPPARAVLSVELVPMMELPDLKLPAGVTPPPRPSPATPLSPADKRRVNGPTQSAPSAAVIPDDDTFYTGPPAVLTQPGVAQGLASVMGNDPCVARYGPKARECAGRDLAKRTGAMDSVLERPKEQLAQHYAEFMAKCPYWSGCDGEYLLSSNGTRSVAKGAPGSGGDRDQPAMMAGGAATLGGLNATTGRLGFNPDFRDRGFGD